MGARLEEFEKAALHARTLTQQLLTFSKGGAPVKNTLSLERVVRDSASVVLSGTSVTHSLSRDERLWSVDADEGQTSQAFNNLLINACQPMPGGGNISIRMENFTIDRAGDLPLDAGNYVRLTIADEGVGIPPEHLPRIFDPYFTTKAGGSGLGRAVAPLRQHRGHRFLGLDQLVLDGSEGGQSPEGLGDAIDAPGLATGGTARAAADLVRQLGGSVYAMAFLIELSDVNGRAQLAGENLHVVLRY